MWQASAGAARFLTQAAGMNLLRMPRAITASLRRSWRIAAKVWPIFWANRRAVMAEPGPDRMPLQPWQLEKVPSDEVVARIPSPPRRPSVVPTAYDRNGPVKMRWPFRNGIPGADLVLRRVRDVIVLPGGLALSHSGELLTLNFLDNRITEHSIARLLLTRRYVYRKAVAAKLGPAVEGPVFAADCFWAGNFGHMLLEVVPTLLLMDQAPDQSLAITSAPITPNTRAMFEQMGVAADRIRKLDAPVRCAEVYYCQPLMRLSGGSHPLLADAFARLAQLGAQGTVTPLERVFFSRARVSKRRLEQEQQVEDLFARYGFTIVHPETLKIADQIRLVANATMLAGLGGSAMHLCAMARPETPVLIIQTVHMPQHVDMSIHDPGRRLGYVFGESVDLSQKIGGGWTVDVADVEAGIKAHFGL
jgi:hypothetical protein